MVRAKTIVGQGAKGIGGHRPQSHSKHANNTNVSGNIGDEMDRGGFKGPLTAPWRKTVSIFKQPVTLVHTTGRETKPMPSHELQAAKGGLRQDKPKQVFWAKRLQNLRAMMPISAHDRDSSRENECFPEPLALPNRIHAVGPDLDKDVAAASLNSFLQGTLHGHAITGQTKARKDLEANPGAQINPDQPLVHAVVVTEQDIIAQTSRVMDMRRRLEESLKHFPL